jgi:hypothetical protein
VGENTVLKKSVGVLSEVKRKVRVLTGTLSEQ